MIGFILGMLSSLQLTALEMVKEVLPDNPVILEAGAHYGEHTAVLSHKWPNGTVHAFEPNPDAFSKLEERTQLLKNVVRYPLGLFDCKAVLPFYMNRKAGNDGASSLLEGYARMSRHYFGPVIEVPVTTLELWQQEHGIDHIDFFWLDLEGAELQVLKGNPNLLEETKAIYAEVNFKEFRKGMTQYEELAEFLRELGFVESDWHPYKWGQADVLFTREQVW